LILLSLSATAGTAYKCADADGHVSFQDKPCAGAAHTEEIRYDDVAPAVEPPPATVVEAPAATIVDPPQPPPAEVAAAPEFYLCNRYDGAQYYSDDGITTPYAMPLGVLGAPAKSLNHAYGDNGKLGVSAPEVSPPAVAKPGTSADIATNYTWVQDECHRLPLHEACAALRSEHDIVVRKIKRSFRDDRPPLEARERTLADKLGGC
jgi:hypothetical protein